VLQAELEGLAAAAAACRDAEGTVSFWSKHAPKAAAAAASSSSSGGAGAGAAGVGEPTGDGGEGVTGLGVDSRGDKAVTDAAAVDGIGDAEKPMHIVGFFQ
jgi:hypothetical protein